MNLFRFHTKYIVAISCGLFFLATLPLTAQETATRYDVFGGYSFLRLDTPSYGYRDYSNLNGAKLSGAFNFTPQISGVADISGYWATNQHFYDFMAGPQYAIHRYGG